MKLKLTIFLILTLLVSPLALQFVPSVNADPSTVATTTALFASFMPYQRKSFYAAGLHWQFYTDGTNMLYKTSSDGITWSNATTIRPCTDGREFSVWFNGTYVYYAFSEGTDSNVVVNNTLYFRRGTPNSDGTTTWSATEQTVKVADASYAIWYPVVAPNSSGYPFIAYEYRITASYLFSYVIKSSTNDGTWTTERDTSLETWGYVYPSILPLTNNKMYAIYVYYTVYGKLWNGSAWGAEETISDYSLEAGPNFHSEAADGDNVYVAMLERITTAPIRDDIRFDYRTTGHIWGTDEIVQASVRASSAPTITVDPVTGNIYCWWAGSPTTGHVFYKKRVSTWDSSPTDCIDESTDGLTSNSRLVSWHKAPNVPRLIGLTYMTKTASPYNIKFAYLSLAAEKSWNFAESWKLNLYTLNWLTTEMWRLNLHNYFWSRSEIWQTLVHAPTWLLYTTDIFPSFVFFMFALSTVITFICVSPVYRSRGKK